MHGHSISYKHNILFFLNDTAPTEFYKTRHPLSLHAAFPICTAAPDFDALAHPGFRSLRAYDPGHDLVALRAAHAGALIELGSNESPFGVAPSVLDAIAATLPDIHRYPDPSGMALKQALATTHGVTQQQKIGSAHG